MLLVKNFPGVIRGPPGGSAPDRGNKREGTGGGLRHWLGGIDAPVAPQLTGHIGAPGVNRTGGRGFLPGSLEITKPLFRVSDLVMSVFSL